MNHNEPFVFYTERRMVALTGRKARNLGELAEGLRTLPGSVIFYHTHHMYLSHHFETPAFSNDFALWVSEALQEEALGERLAAIDLLDFTSIRDLREAILKVVEPAAADSLRAAPPGDEFHFAKSKSFVMSTGLVARDPEEFFALLPRVSNVSLFFHFFEARLRLERRTNDFTQWLAWRGEERLAREIERLDPYSMSLDELKEKILGLGRRRAA